MGGTVAGCSSQGVVSCGDKVGSPVQDGHLDRL